jgi:hypothetical protein
VAVRWNGDIEMVMWSRKWSFHEFVNRDFTGAMALGPRALSPSMNRMTIRGLRAFWQYGGQEMP